MLKYLLLSYKKLVSVAGVGYTQRRKPKHRSTIYLNYQIEKNRFWKLTVEKNSSPGRLLKKVLN